MSFIFKISGASLSCRQVDPIQKHHSQAEGSTRTYSATCLVTDKSKEMNKKKKNVRFADTIKVASYANLTGGSITRHADESVAWSRKARLDDSGEEYVKLRR